MPDYRSERTSYLGLLALMLATADTDNWSYPYWNVKQVDAALAALAQAVRDGTVPLLGPAAAPTAAVSTSPGSIAGGVTLEIGQTFVDEYGRETGVGPLATVVTDDAISDPVNGPTLGTPTLGGASGYEGGLLEVWFSWTDGAGGETLPSSPAQVDVPYQSGALKSEVDVTLPCAPAVAGAAGANIYLRHRGGNVVLAYRILVDDVSEITLTGAVADCYRSLPLANSAASANAIDITGVAGPAGAALTRFYVRISGAAWPADDRRLKLAGVDEWNPDTVTYPLLYTGATGELVAGFPPTVSQVKAIRPIDLTTEAMGTLPVDQLPAMVTLETELVRSMGAAVMSGLAVSAHTPADMGVRVVAGEALVLGGRTAPAQTDLVIPIADLINPRIDIICMSDDGALEGPTENAALKGVPGAVPEPPDMPAGYLKLAEVGVAANATTIIADDVTDSRWMIPTLVAAVLEFRDADIYLDTLIDNHATDAEAHSSKPYAFATVNDDCAGSFTSDFEIVNSAYVLVTWVGLVCTTAGAIDYDLELFINSARTTLAYKAEGITAASWEDRIPWEFFSAGSFYGRITNNSTDAITNLAITLKYRK